MKLRKNRLKKLFPIFLAGIFCLALAATVGRDLPIFAVDETMSNAVKNFVTFYDGEEINTYRTDAKTVEEALKRAKIKVNDGDIVEPALDERITTQNFNINIYRARKVVVRDGDKQIHLTTASHNPREIAKKAGVELRAEDELKLMPNNSLLESGMLTAYRVARKK